METKRSKNLKNTDIMKNKRTIKLNFEESEQIVNLEYIHIDATWVDCKTLLQAHPNALLIECKHKFLQTQFALNDTDPCKLLVFDKDRKYVATKTNYHKGTAPFSFLISEQYVLILPINYTLKKQKITSISLLN